MYTVPIEEETFRKEVPYNLNHRLRPPRLKVCLTRVCQSLLPLFCDKTFKYAIQTWQPFWSTTTCMYKHTFCLSSAKC